MGLTFYYGSGSPFAWRVWMALEHLGVDYDLTTLSFSAGEHRTDEYAAINPRKRVPGLVDGDFTLYESGAIVEYLAERFPDGPRLFPADREQRAIVRRMIHEIDSHTWAENWKLAKELFFKRDPATRDQGSIQDGIDGVKHELAFFEERLDGGWLGSELSAADFTLYPFVATHARFDKVQPELELVEARGPNVRAWCSRIEALPWFGKTVPPHWK